MEITNRGCDRVDQPLSIEVTGLEPHEAIQVTARMGGPSCLTWSSVSTARADAAGWSVLSENLISSMVSEPSVRYSDNIRGSIDPLALQLSITGDHGSGGEATLERRFLTGEVAVKQWRGEVVANLFLPQQRRAGRAVLVLGGAWGEFCWSNEVAAVLASSGAPALALAYFDWDGDHGLPTTISQLPLEYVDRAIDWLERYSESPASSEIDVVGVSKGAELSLLVATHRSNIRRLVAYAPSSHVWESVRSDGSQPATSSWSRDGEPIPFLRFEADDQFYEDLDKSRLASFHQSALAEAAADHPARIPVENITADVLVMSLQYDTVWPSATMGSAIVDTMRRHGRCARELIVDGCGHTLFVPGLPANTVDDVAARSALADRRSWQALHRHLGLS